MPVPLIIAGGIAAAGAATAVGASQQKKAQESAQSFAEKQASDAKAEQQRLEEKFGLTPGELERQDRVFELEKKRQTELERRAGMPIARPQRPPSQNVQKPSVQPSQSSQPTTPPKSEELFLSEAKASARQNEMTRLANKYGVGVDKIELLAKSAPFPEGLRTRTIADQIADEVKQSLAKAESAAEVPARQNFANYQAEQSRVAEQEMQRNSSLQQATSEFEGFTNQQLTAQEQAYQDFLGQQFPGEREADISRVTGEDLLRETGPITSGLLDSIQSRQGKTGEELFLADTGAVGQQYVDRVSQPAYEDLLKNELELVTNRINAEANRRGVFGGQPEGGIRFEQLGRAGVDLAINSARESLAQKAAASEAFINLSQNARAEAGTVGESAMGASDRARAELDQFLTNIQSLDASAKGRALSAAGLGSQVLENANARSFGINSDIFGQRAGQGAALQNAGIGFLGDIAGFGIDAAIPGGSRQSGKPATDQILGQSVDPLTSVRLRSGGANLNDDFLAEDTRKKSRKFSFA